jgi:hypothetical protein
MLCFKPARIEGFVCLIEFEANYDKLQRGRPAKFNGRRWYRLFFVTEDKEQAYI